MQSIFSGSLTYFLLNSSFRKRRMESLTSRRDEKKQLSNAPGVTIDYQKMGIVSNNFFLLEMAYGLQQRNILPQDMIHHHVKIFHLGFGQRSWLVLRCITSIT